MDVVIVGAGEVGIYLADILSRERHRVSVVDNDPAKIERVHASLDVETYLGDGAHPEILNRAGASRCELFVAVTDDDKVNMLACRMARELGAGRVVLRLHETERLEGYHYFHKRALGYDVVLSTDELAADEILATVREQHALEVESFADGRVQLRRLRIRETSELTAETLSALELPGGLLVAAIARKNEFFVPTGEDQLAVDDQVYLIGRGADLDQFEVLSGARKLGRRSVVIMGGGHIGLRIAERLEEVPGISVRLFERDAARAREIAQRFTKSVMVLVGDATDLDLLGEERIGDQTNIFVAATSRDEDNMMACQLASSLGVERTVALVNKPSYRKIYSLLGIDNAISPRILCANRILRFVRAGSVSSIAVVAEGRGEVIEIEARFYGGKTESRVKNLGLPRGVVIGAVVCGEEVEIARGETLVKEGDRLILFALPAVVEELRKVFRSQDD